MNDKTFASQVWNNLAYRDCSSMVEKKGGLSYLSWANAWTLLMNEYPDSGFKFLDSVTLPDQSVEVHVEVGVSDGEGHLITRTMSLPVMDYKNKAIQSPSSRDISDNRMRCLVKCIALFGLGLFLYRGEDLPQKPAPAKQVKPATKAQLDKIATIKDLTDTQKEFIESHQPLGYDIAAKIIAKMGEK
jgi:hypothetical protein